MKGMITGRYITGDSLIHRLDPRTKLVGCLIVIINAALPQNQIPVLLFNLLFLIVVTQLAQVGVKRVLHGLYSLKSLFLLTFICQVFLTPGDPVLNSGGLVITWQGIYLAASTFPRLILLYLVSVLLTITTSPLALSAGIDSLLSPLAYLRVPVHQFAMIISICLRFIPTIMEEIEVITRAQKSRGARFDYGPLPVRVRTMLAVLVPLLAASLQRANDLALAMESRCYMGDSPNNRIRNLHLAQIDRVAVVVVAVVSLLPVLYYQL